MQVHVHLLQLQLQPTASNHRRQKNYTYYCSVRPSERQETQQ